MGFLKAPPHHHDEAEGCAYRSLLFTNFYLLYEIRYLNMLCLMSCCTSEGVSFVLQRSTM